MNFVSRNHANVFVPIIPSECRMVESMQNLQTTWSCMFPMEQYAIIHLLISRITVRLDEVKIEYNIDGIEQIFKEAGAILHD